MPNPDQIHDADFDSQLRGLFQEAEQCLEDRVAASRRSDEERERETARLVEERAARAQHMTLPQMLRPLVLGLEALTRAFGEHSTLLGKLDHTVAETSGSVTGAHQAVPALVENLHAVLDQKNTISQRMFDALHEELKSYKDDFLLESIQKPIIHNLISVYDNLTEIHRQMEEALVDASTAAEPAPGLLMERLKTMDTNIAHNCEFLVEVLERFEVVQLPVSFGKLDKHTQRVVAVESAAEPAFHGDIVRSVKRGFTWKGRVVRAEEVVIRRWQQGGGPSKISGSQL